MLPHFLCLYRVSVMGNSQQQLDWNCVSTIIKCHLFLCPIMCLVKGAEKRNNPMLVSHMNALFPRSTKKKKIQISKIFQNCSTIWVLQFCFWSLLRFLKKNKKKYFFFFKKYQHVMCKKTKFTNNNGKKRKIKINLRANLFLFSFQYNIHNIQQTKQQQKLFE